MISSADQGPRHIRAFFEGESGFVLCEMTARCALSEMFKFELTLLHGDTKTPVDPARVIGLGATVQLELPTESENREYFGLISEIHQIGWSDRGITYRATMVPALWFLTQRNNCRIFQNMETSEIVEQVLRDAGVDEFEFQLSGDYAKREYCVQYRETDFNFVSRLLEEDGIFYFFKHEEGKHTLIMSDAASSYFDLDEPKVHFPKPGQNYPNRKEFQTWNERYQFIPGSFSQKDFNFKEPGTDLFRSRTSLVQLPNNQACEFYDYHGRYDDGANGLHLTEVRMGEAETNYQTGFATSQLSYLHPAGIFKFGSHCIESRQGKEYVVTSLEFDARAADYVTGDRFEEDEFYRNRITCIPADRVFRPTRRAARPFVQGPQTAIVTTDGDEINVDEHGRVKVHFHWDRYNEFNETSSCWIRVSQVHAGEGFGMMDIPRRNEEVIVSFIEGDPDRPIITGRVYNGSNRPPYDLSEGPNETNKTRRGNATKSIGKDTGSYNEMTMDDTPGKEQIRIHGQYNMDTTVEYDQTVTVNNNRTKTIAINETNSIGLDQTEDVGNNRTTSIAVNDSESVGVNQTISVGTNQSTSVGTMQSNNVGMIQNEMIGIAANQMVGAAKAVTVGAVLNTAVGLMSTEQVGIKKSTMVGSTYKITAGSKFEISCGASKLTMDSGGKVTITGTEFNFTASGAVEINGAIIDLN